MDPHNSDTDPNAPFLTNPHAADTQEQTESALLIEVPMWGGQSRTHRVMGNRLHVGVTSDSTVIIDPDGRMTENCRELTFERRGPNTWVALNAHDEPGTRFDGQIIVAETDVSDGGVMQLGARGENEANGRVEIAVQVEKVDLPDAPMPAENESAFAQEEAPEAVAPLMAPEVEAEEPSEEALAAPIEQQQEPVSAVPVPAPIAEPDPVAEVPSDLSKEDLLDKLEVLSRKLGQVSFELELQLIDLSNSALRDNGVDVPNEPGGKNLEDRIARRQQLEEDIVDHEITITDRTEATGAETAALSQAVIPLQEVFDQTTNETNNAKRASLEASRLLQERSTSIRGALEPVLGSFIDALRGTGDDLAERGPDHWLDWALALDEAAADLRKRHDEVEMNRMESTDADENLRRLTIALEKATNELKSAKTEEAEALAAAEAELNAMQQRKEELAGLVKKAKSNEREALVGFARKALENEDSPMRSFSGFDNACELAETEAEIQQQAGSLRRML